jgi:hypothetical protein
MFEVKFNPPKKENKMLYNLENDVYKINSVVLKNLKSLNGSRCGAIDKPAENLVPYEELIKGKKLKPGTSWIALVKVKYLYSDSDYNRPDELNIEKIFNALKRAKGFGYRHSNVLVASLRPDGKLVLTQGNHRTLMALIAMGSEAEVMVNIHVHEEYEVNSRQMYRIESDDFNTDALIREAMKANQKFKGAYMAEEPWALKLYSFLSEYKVSIAKTNTISVGPLPTFKEKKTFEAYARLQEAYEIDTTPKKKYVCQALSSLVKNLKETDINGAAFCGLVIFLRDFESRLIQFESKGYTLDNFIYYIYNEVLTQDNFGPVLKQKDISNKGSLKIGTYEFFASRFVILFNRYARENKIKIRRNECYAIPETCIEWINFIGREDVNARSVYKVWGHIA